MSGKLTIEILGREFELSGKDIESLMLALRTSLDGGIVSIRLEHDAKPPKPVKGSTFRFFTKRGTERLTKPEQQQLLVLAAKVVAGESQRWPPEFKLTHLGTSD